MFNGLASVVLGKFFFVLAHLLFKFLNDAIQRDNHVGTMVSGKEITRLFGGHTDFDQRRFVVFQIDDHANRGRSIKESRQALYLVADGLLNGVTQVTVLC